MANIITRITSLFKKKEKIPVDPGVILLKPSEKEKAAGLYAKTGATIEIPETKKVYVPKEKEFVPYERAPPTKRRRREPTPSQRELLEAMPAPPTPEVPTTPTPTPTPEVPTTPPTVYETATGKPVTPKPTITLPPPPTKAELYTTFGTRTDLAPRIDIPKIQIQPYITERQIDEFRGVPITETVYIDPTVEGKQLERPATEEEKEFYKQQREAEIYKGMPSFPNTPEGREEARKWIKKTSRRAERKYKQEEFIAPIKEQLETRIVSAETEEKIKENIKKTIVFSSPILKVLPKDKQENVADIMTGVVAGVIPWTTGALMLDTITVGAGALLGAGVRAGEKMLVTATRKVAPKLIKKPEVVAKVVKVVPRIYKAAEATAGVGLGAVYVSETAKRVKEAPTYLEKGEIIGRGAKELALFGYGFGKGKEWTGKGISIWETRGMERIKPPVRESVFLGKETFPEAGKRLSQSQRAQLHKAIFEKGEYVKEFRELSPKELQLINKAPEQYAKFNLYSQLKFKEKSIFPRGHAYPHAKEVGLTIQKLMKAYPEYNSYWIKKYGSLKQAKIEMTKAMWHDIMKVSAVSEKEGLTHGESFYKLWKAGKLPKELQSIKPEVAKAIKIHDLPSKFAKTPEAKFLMTADIMSLERYGIKVEKLPLKDARSKLIGLEDMKFDYKPTKFTKEMETFRTKFLKDYEIKAGKIIVETKVPAPGLHMTAAKLVGEKITRPLHIAPEASVHFLGVGKKYKIPKYLKGMFEPTPEPVGYAITPKRYEITKGREIKRGEYVWQKEVKPGVAYITGEKPEIQSVFVPETKLIPTQKEAYFIYKGYRIPIKGYKAIEDKISIKPPKKVITYEQLMKKMVSKIPSYPKISPIVISIKPSVSKLTPSYKPSIYKPSVSKLTPSYKPSVSKSKPSSYLPSYVSKYKPSKTSYKPSYPYSPKPSYKPSVSKYKPSSYLPSYVSKYKPSKTPYKPSYPYSPKPIPPKYPLIRIPRIPSKPKKKKSTIKRKPKKGEYTGYIRRYGKWKQISKGSKAQATAQVKRKIKKELGASYKVQGPAPSKKYVMLPITRQFRRSKSKKEPYVVIEKRKYRLDSPKEVREIKVAKKAAPKKKRRTTKSKNIFWSRK